MAIPEQVIEILIGVALGILSGLLLSFVAELLKKRVRRKRELEASLRAIVKDVKDMRLAEAIVEETLESESKDRRATFTTLVIDLEGDIRNLAATALDFRKPVPIHEVIDLLIGQNILTREWKMSFQALWYIRNRVFHGVSIADEEIRKGTTLAASLMLDLERRRKEISGKKGDLS